MESVEKVVELVRGNVHGPGVGLHDPLELREGQKKVDGLGVHYRQATVRDLWLSGETEIAQVIGRPTKLSAGQSFDQFINQWTNR